MSFANSTTLTLTPSYAHHFSATSTPLNTTATTTAATTITISTPPPLTPPPPPPPSLTTTASNAAISGIKISNMTAVTSFITNTNSSNSSQFGVNLAEATTATPWLNPAYNDLAFNASTAYDASYFEACDPDNPHFNCSREKYLEFEHGPQRLPLQKALMVTIIFGGIFITGVLGNVLVCVVIVRHSMMHTATNYYLFSLALSDLLYLLFGLPAEVFHYWHQYPYLFGLPFCKIRAFISEASSYVSVLTILAFSMERFLAICHPLHLYAMSGFKRALRIIAGLWILSFMTAIPFGLMTDIVYLHYPKDNSRIHESAYCSIAHIPENLPVFELSFCIFFVIPMVLIMVLYGGMGAKIRSRTIQQLGVQQGSMHRESRHQQSKRAIIRMLAAVVITFFICWLPFHLQRLWFLYGQNHENFDEINEWMFSFTGFTYYVSCTINPILYNVMSLRYRLAFKEILCGQRRNTHHNNGFVKDQSSFRETTLASSLGGGGNTNTERPQSFRVRTMRHVNITRKSESLRSTSGLVWSRKTDCSMPLKQNAAGDSLLHSTVVVVDKSVNGRSKVCCTENVLHENLINKSNETCI